MRALLLVACVDAQIKFTCDVDKEVAKYPNLRGLKLLTNAVQLDARGVSSWDYFHALVYANRASFTNALRLDFSRQHNQLAA